MSAQMWSLVLDTRCLCRCVCVPSSMLFLFRCLSILYSLAFCRSTLQIVLNLISSLLRQKRCQWIAMRRCFLEYLQLFAHVFVPLCKRCAFTHTFSRVYDETCQCSNLRICPINQEFKLIIKISTALRPRYLFHWINFIETLRRVCRCICGEMLFIAFIHFVWMNRFSASLYQCRQRLSLRFEHRVHALLFVACYSPALDQFVYRTCLR